MYEIKIATYPSYYEHDEQTDWILSLSHATYVHTNYCDFIFYVNDDYTIQEYQDLGFSMKFIELAKKTKNAGYEYMRLTN